MGEHRVVISYAAVLAEHIPPLAVRLRRDFGQILTLIRAHALLHQASRGRDSQGRIAANLDDYAVVRELVADLVADGVEATVPKTVRETVGAVRQRITWQDKAVTVVEVARALKLDKSAAYRRVQVALDRGYLDNLEERKGRPARLVLAAPLPDDVSILPTVEELAEWVHGCSDSEGVTPPPLPPPAGVCVVCGKEPRTQAARDIGKCTAHMIAAEYQRWLRLVKDYKEVT